MARPPKKSQARELAKSVGPGGHHLRILAEPKRAALCGLLSLLIVAVIGAVVVSYLNRPERGVALQERVKREVEHARKIALPERYAIWRESSNPRGMRQYDLVCTGDTLDLGSVVQSDDFALWNADVRVGMGGDATSVEELWQKADLAAAQAEVVQSARYDLCK